ncbi:MAG: hypothetical protein M3Q98_16820 [Actinomycetota bacterium]|nr:hypothetical protein [Actinomycetota bacterium]
MTRDVKVLAALFTVSGIGHFVKPEPFEAIVPKPLPNKRELVYLSGAMELACVALLANPKTRRIGGLTSAAVLTGVFPANVQMTLSSLRSQKAPAWYKAGTVARLPLQFPLIRMALRTAKA